MFTRINRLQIPLPKQKSSDSNGAAAVHRKLYRFRANDYKDIAMIWKGRHLEDGGKLEVIKEFHKVDQCRTWKVFQKSLLREFLRLILWK